MIRRLNYTGRARIAHSDVHLSLCQNDGLLSFDAELHLSDYELPADALVFVEAYRQTTWMRFYFGTVAMVKPPEDRQLKEFDLPDGIKFRVKVTQPKDEHIILAVADKLPFAKPDEDANRDSLLVAEPADLGDELWYLDLKGSEPSFLVNSKAVANWRQLARSPIFTALVYPEVLRQVLLYILADNCYQSEDADDWRSNWLRFATSLPGVNTVFPDKTDGDDAIRNWVDDIVSAFAKKHAMKDSFVREWVVKEGE